MLRIRLGQNWKRERERRPVDAFALEIDGLALLPQAGEEPLSAVVPALVDAAYALAQRGERFAQVSLAETRVELCLSRVGSVVQLQLVDLGRPTHLARQLTVGLDELVDATRRCGRQLLEDLEESLPAEAGALRRRMAKKLLLLERSAPEPALPAPVGFAHWRFAAPRRFGFLWQDGLDRVRAFHGRSLGALTTLLGDGEVWLAGPAGERLWAGSGPPFLIARELTRLAADVGRAQDAGEGEVSAAPAPGAPTLQVDVKSGQVLGVPFSVDELLRACFELGLSVGVAAAQANPAQLRNPYLEELSARCREGLAPLRRLTSPEEGGAARVRRTPRRKDVPLRAPGRLRRVRLLPLWRKHNLGGESPGRILLGAAGPVFSSLEMACGFTRDGEVLYRRIATHGVAADAGGRVLCGTLDRVLAFRDGEASARWLRDHDSLVLGPALRVHEGLWLTVSDGRVVLAFDEVTGRERWRLDPPRSQRSFLSVQGHRALVATDAGHLYGLDLSDGQVRFRMGSGLPFLGPMVAWGRRAIGTLGRDGTCALFAADAHTGHVSWARELKVGLRSEPLPLGSRLWVAAERRGESVMMAMSSKGIAEWEHALPVEGGAVCLSPLGRSVAVTAANGAAVVFDPDGELRWRLEPCGAAGPSALPIAKSRGLLLVPGAKVRAVNPATGEVLGEIETTGPLRSMAVDGRLNLYLLDEEGTLSALHLATHLSVV